MKVNEAWPRWIAMEKREDLITRIVSHILAAAHAQGVTIKDRYLNDEDYEKYQEISRQREPPNMRICGANIQHAIRQSDIRPEDQKRPISVQHR